MAMRFLFRLPQRLRVLGLSLPWKAVVYHHRRRHKTYTSNLRVCFEKMACVQVVQGGLAAGDSSLRTPPPPLLPFVE